MDRRLDDDMKSDDVDPDHVAFDGNRIVRMFDEKISTFFPRVINS